jgi:ADP-ribose pyrophosphatase YjhB (NUDIX family)
VSAIATRHRVVVGVHLVLRRDGAVLLGLRARDLPFGAGLWHLPSGHLEAGEMASHALVREAHEELGIVVYQPRLVHTMHHGTDDGGRLALFFEAASWTGEPTNREPGKCDALRWFPLLMLPTSGMVPYALAALRSREPYSEMWS